MQTEYSNKQMGSGKKNNSLEEFHFSGGGEYIPMTILATDRAEAEKEWEQKRTKVASENNK
jgi:hypothetical protein